VSANTGKQHQHHKKRGTDWCSSSNAMRAFI